MKRTIRAAAFCDVETADRAVAKLLAAGYSRNQVSVLSSATWKAERISRREGVRTEGTPQWLSWQAARDGVMLGGGMGGAVGVLLALGGLIYGAGALVTLPIILVATAGGAVVGALISEMRMRGVEKESADFYDQAVDPDSVLVAVDASEEGSLHTAAPADQVFGEMAARPVALAER